MRRKRTKVNTIRLPEDIRTALANIVHGTGWSFNVATANVLRLGLATIINDLDGIKRHYNAIVLQIRARAIREEAECKVKQLKPQRPPVFGCDNPPRKQAPTSTTPPTPSLSA